MTKLKIKDKIKLNYLEQKNVLLKSLFLMMFNASLVLQPYFFRFKQKVVELVKLKPILILKQIIVNKNNFITIQMTQIGLVNNPLKIFQKTFNKKRKTLYIQNVLLTSHIQLEHHVSLALDLNILIMIQKNVLIAIMAQFFQRISIIALIKLETIKQILKQLLI